MPEAFFALVVAIAMPARAWRRHRRSAPPAPAARYVAETLALTAALAALLWRNEVPLAAIGLGRHTLLGVLGDLLLCLAVVLGPDVWSVRRAIRRIRQSGAVLVCEGVFADALAGGRAVASFAVVSIVGSAWEELCFRAALFLLVPPTWPWLVLATAGGSLVFGAQHLRNGWRAALYSSGYGVVFSVLYLITDNLVAVVVAHAAGNILAAVQWAPRIERARLEASSKTPIFIG